MQDDKSQGSLSGLFSNLINELRTLFRQEMLLAKREMTDKIGQVKTGATSLAIGGVLVFSGFLVLLFCAVLALSNVLAPWLSALIVGAVVVWVGGMLLLKGRNDLNAESLAPEKTIHSLRRDQELAKSI